MADIKQIKVGTTTYDIKDGTAREALSEKVSKAGDTMTGNLWISNGLIKGSNPSSDTTRYVSFVDGEGIAVENRTGAVINQVKTDGTSFTGIYAYDFTADSAQAQVLRTFKPQGGNGYSNVSSADVSSAVLRNIGYGTGSPSGGSDGDVYIQYNTASTHPFLDLVYPVGAIYLSTVNTNPGTLFGGTWSQIKDRFLLAAGDTYAAGGTGGAATVTLSKANMPAHTHTRGTMEIKGSFRINDDGNNAGLDAASSGSGAISAVSGTGTGSDVDGSGWAVTKGFDFQASKNWSGATSSEGSGTAHENMPPYLTVYVWKRTA